MNRIASAVVVAVCLLTVAACGSLLPGGGQSKECKDYVACAEKVSPGTKATNDSSFGPNGSCFATGVKAAADQCTATCKTGNDAYKANGQAADAGCTF